MTRDRAANSGAALPEDHKPPLDRRAEGKRHAKRQWEAYRADRLARGLPATVREERRRKPERFSEVEFEDYWLGEAANDGILAESMTSAQRGRVALRYANAVTAEMTRRAARGDLAPLSTTDRLIAYHTARIADLTLAARRSRARADEEDRVRAEHEAELARLLLDDEGRLSL